MSVYWREVTVGYARLRGSMGATVCYLAALRSAIEFLFWDHRETAVYGQILAGRSRKVTGGHGSKFLPFGGPSAAYWISLLWSRGHGRFGPNPGREVTGCHGRSWEVTVGYGRLRRKKTEESGGTAGKRFEKNERIWRKIVKSSGKTEENGGTPKLNGEQRPLGFGTR